MWWVISAFLAFAIVFGVAVSILRFDEERLRYWILLAQLNPVPTRVTALLILIALLLLSYALVRLGSKRRRR